METEALLRGKFYKVSQEEKIIKDKDGKEDGRYYVIGLSNGRKTFEVTAGEKNSIVAIPVMRQIIVDFDIIDKKIKVLSSVEYGNGGKHDGEK